MTCEAMTRQGARCKAPPLTGGRFCFHHDPEKATERRQARRKGGLVLHHGSADRERPEVRLREVSDVLALLEEAAADAMTRKPGIARARCLTYVSTAAVRVIEASDLEERVRALEARINMREVS
jgi:hypothetical protein